MAFDESQKDQYDKWLQTEFAAALVERLSQAFEQSPTAEIIKKFNSEAGFGQWRYVPDLWIPKHNLLTRFGKVADKTGKGGFTMVLASSQLIAVLRKLKLYKWPSSAEEHDPTQALNALLRSSFRIPGLMFIGRNDPDMLFQTCDHILDKAYVRAVIIASKFLGPDRFPNGIYGLWPPEPPADFHTSGFQPV